MRQYYIISATGLNNRQSVKQSDMVTTYNRIFA